MVFFCLVCTWFSRKTSKICIRPICHCHKACRDINVENKQGNANQTKYRKYYKSGSTSDIRHFDHTVVWEMAHNSQCCPFFHPKWFQTFLPARFVHHGLYSPQPLNRALDWKGMTYLHATCYMQHFAVVRSRLISKSCMHKWQYFCSGCWHRSGVLQSNIFTANLFQNGIVLEYISNRFGRNYAQNVQLKH